MAAKFDINTFVVEFNKKFGAHIWLDCVDTLLIVRADPSLIHNQKKENVVLPKELVPIFESTNTSPIYNQLQNFCLPNAIMQQLIDNDISRLEKWNITHEDLKIIALMCEGETDINAMTGSENFFIILSSLISATIIIYDRDHNCEIMISPAIFEGQALTMVFNLQYAHYTAIPLYKEKTKIIKTEFAKTEFAKTEFAKTEFAKTEFAKTEFAKTEFAKTEFAKTEFTDAEIVAKLVAQETKDAILALKLAAQESDDAAYAAKLAESYD